MKIFQIRGDLDKNILEQVNLDTPTPQSDEILIRHEAIGVNFADYEILRRPAQAHPIIPGIEAVGFIESIGKDVSNFKIGQRVGYATVSSGAFAEYRTIKPQYIFPIHDSISSEAAVLNMVKGMTAHYLMRRTFFTREGMTILIHGAASNVGKLMLRLAKEYKINVIGTVGSEDKKQLVKDLGSIAVYNYKNEDFVQNINDLTKKAGVHAVYDLIGGDLLKKSLKSMMNFGLAVSVGNAQEKSHPINPALLSNRSLFVTSPRLIQYKREKPELMLSIMEIFGFIQAGIFPKEADKKYSFDQIPEAMSDIASRIPSSKVILL